MSEKFRVEIYYLWLGGQSAEYGAIHTEVNIEIDGIPETKKENLDAVLQDMMNIISVKFNKDKMVSTSPIQQRKELHRSLWNSQYYQERDTWISRYLRTLTVDQINTIFDNWKVFKNENLSPENKLLLLKTKETARNGDYKYVWCREGKIFVGKLIWVKCISCDFQNL